MTMENDLVFSDNEFLFSQVVEDTESLEAKLIICGFGANRNGVVLNRQKIETWVGTLVNQPLLGKVSATHDDGKCDFEGHNLYVVNRTKEDGTSYKSARFDTSAVGVFTSVQIEKIRGIEYITATAKIWKRFPEFCAVIKRRLAEGSLKSSWEIAVKKSHTENINGKPVKVIDEGNFIGHTLLGVNNPPAYNESELLEVATQHRDSDILDALEKDMARIDPEAKEEETILSKKNEPEVSEVTPVVNNEPEQAALTEYDLRKALRQAIAEKLNIDKWEFCIVYHFPVDAVVWVQKWNTESELDVIQFTYAVENDVVHVSDGVEAKLTVSVAQINSAVADLQKKIDEQNEALIESSTKIQNLTSQVSDLTPFKEKFEKSEQERIEKELSERRESLKAYALKSGHISADDIEKSEEVLALIESVNESGIKAIIAERFMASLENKPVEVEFEPETAQTRANIAIDDESDVVDHKSFIKNYIGGNR